MSRRVKDRDPQETGFSSAIRQKKTDSENKTQINSSGPPGNKTGQN
jgi:hypothetical protein